MSSPYLIRASHEDHRGCVIQRSLLAIGRKGAELFISGVKASSLQIALEGIIDDVCKLLDSQVDPTSSAADDAVD